MFLVDAKPCLGALVGSVRIHDSHVRHGVQIVRQGKRIGIEPNGSAAVLNRFLPIAGSGIQHGRFDIGRREFIVGHNGLLE